MHLQIFILAVIYFVGGHGNSTATPTIPNFGNVYHAKGRLRLPYAELDEPFEVYFNKTQKVGRLDFYDGLDKVFYRGDMSTFGQTFKISPSVSGQGSIVNPVSCFQINGTKAAPIMPQSLLPNTTGFKYIGQKSINGMMTDQFQLSVAGSPAKISTYTLSITAAKPIVPVRYEMKGYDSLIGSHYDKYIIDYTYFDNKMAAIPMSIFQTPIGITCTGFPGPGIEQDIIANPFRELVNPEHGDRYDKLFNEYKKKHNKVYTDDAEHAHRKTQFTHNVRYIHGHNRQGHTFTLGINPMADQSQDEIRLMRGRQRSTGYNGGAPFPHEQFNEASLPDSMDWRLQGAVSQVKDQATCGSCWSFGTTETIEGAYFLKNKKMVRFSQQNLMDCSWGYGNNGCDGGEEWRAYSWIMKNGGLMSEEDYGAYMGQNGMCHFDVSKAIVKLDKYINVTSKSINNLKMALANIGPIAVGIDASQKSFSFYSSGIYNDKNCGNTEADLDHAVLAVGYGTKAHGPFHLLHTNYWIIKNSWSTYWGDNGYVLMDQKDNNCGVATDATYVVLK